MGLGGTASVGGSCRKDLSDPQEENPFVISAPMNPSSRPESRMPYSQNEATAKSRCILTGCTATIFARLRNLEQRTRRSAREPDGKSRSSKGRTPHHEKKAELGADFTTLGDQTAQT